MHATSTSVLTVTDPTPQLEQWCKEHLVLDNPEYLSRVKMCKKTWGVPQHIKLYVQTPESIIMPSGCAPMLKDILTVHRSSYIRYQAVYDTDDCDLYDHQNSALADLLTSTCGVLEAPCGAGKTRVMLSAVAMLGLRTLWIAHTVKLVNQARDVAIDLFGKAGMGFIGKGKSDVKERITFATIQSLAKMDLTAISDAFDCVIVDECHHVAGGITSVSMYAHVLNAIDAPIKWGCTATAYRQDGLTFSMHALLGPTVAIVPREEADINRVPFVYHAIPTTWGFDPKECTDSYGVLSYTKAETMMIEDSIRNTLVAETISQAPKPCLVLSTRLAHLDILCAMIPGVKVKALKKNETTAGHEVLYATYSLLSEGYDQPDLKSIVLASPVKDRRRFEQSVGRVLRKASGKTEGHVYDIADVNAIMFGSWAKVRAGYAKRMIQ